jgi:23S rRNA pseudouridine1911/1915/1917 synthase
LEVGEAGSGRDAVDEGGDADDRASIRRLIVAPEDAGLRLDQLLVRAAPGWSRTRLQSLIKAGRARVAGSVVTRPGLVLDAGAVLELDLPEAPPPGAVPPRTPPLAVIHEDEHVVVVDKPVGLVTHRNEKFQSGTVSDLAVARYGPLPDLRDEGRPGIVHRLDRETSGVLLLARSEVALRELKRQFKHREVEKTYLALVHGDPRFDSEWIESRIGPSARGADRQAVVAGEEGREAATYFEVRERFPGFAFLACQPRTGRTHQIRVHLSSIDLPIVGDRLYRTASAQAHPLPKDAPRLERQALHAHAIAFTHPATGERVRYESPLPADMSALLRWLRVRTH